MSYVTEQEKNSGISGPVAVVIAIGALMVGLLSGLVLGAAGGYVIGQARADDSSDSTAELGVAARTVSESSGDVRQRGSSAVDDESGETDAGDVADAATDDGEAATDEEGDTSSGRPELRGPFDGTVPDASEGFSFRFGPGLAVMGDESPFLGVIVSTVGVGDEPPPTDAETGAYIEQIEADSGAEIAGLLPGDVIVSFDGLAIETKEDLAEAVAEKEVGDDVTVVLDRDGEEVVLKVTLGSRPMPVQIDPSNIDELFDSLPPELQERFRELLEQQPEQPEA
ncbi:MAG: PDZ domain-containing protein [Anaerolineae bacterium]